MFITGIYQFYHGANPIAFSKIKEIDNTVNIFSVEVIFLQVIPQTFANVTHIGRLTHVPILIVPAYPWFSPVA